MKIAIVGTGISGLAAAHALAPHHRLTLFEASHRPGGHSHTHDITHAGRHYAIDTGFIVFNNRTYPGFVGLLNRLGIASRPTTMSFSVRHDALDLEYNGASLAHLFAQNRNLVRPGFFRMLRDIARVGAHARAAANSPAKPQTLRDFVIERRLSREFVEWYLVPMTSAIWSASDNSTLDLPFDFFRTFFQNHGFFDMGERPIWRTVIGGSRTYVNAILAPLTGSLRLACPVRTITRLNPGVAILSAAGPETFDAVVLATHSDTALSLLTDPSDSEASILSALPYELNHAVLHTDTSLLPCRRKVWAAWNARVGAAPHPRARVTYNMNMLQGLSPPDSTQFLVTLNQTESINPASIIQQMEYHHPQYTAAGFAAQERHHEISGLHDTYFCGAYWRYGFHEDGFWSGTRAAAQIHARACLPGPAGP